MDINSGMCLLWYALPKRDYGHNSENRSHWDIYKPLGCAWPIYLIVGEHLRLCSGQRWKSCDIRRFKNPSPSRLLLS